MEYAAKNAKTKEEMLEVDFFSLYLRKLTALQNGISYFGLFSKLICRQQRRISKYK